MYKNILIFAGGIILGAVGTYLITNKKIKDKYEEISTREITEVKQLYLSKCRKQDEIKKLNDEKERMMETIQANRYSVMDEEEDGEEQLREAEAPVEHPDTPYVITPDQFVNEKRYYEKLTLLYYEDDETLTNEIDDRIEDIDTSIGAESIDHFGEWEPDVVYVRNDRIGIDYEVILQHSAYGDTGP